MYKIEISFFFYLFYRYNIIGTLIIKIQDDTGYTLTRALSPILFFFG